jgi:AcrR family transcriptional regulator
MRIEPMSNSAKQLGRPRDEAARTRIQQAAVELLIEGGFLNLTCDAIAQRAGTSKATIYRWWPNKVQVVIDAFIDTLSPHLQIYPADTLVDFISIHVRQFIKVMSGQNGKLLAAVLAAAQVVPELHEAYLVHWLKPRRELLQQTLRRFQQSGELPAQIDVDVVIDALYGPLHMLLMVQRCRLKPSYAEKLTQILVNGVAKTARKEIH